MNTDLLHPLSAARPGTLLQLVSAYGCQPRFIPRLGCAALVSVLRQPFTWYESVRYRTLLRKQTISPDPVFIIGHWRSGTTHLHTWFDGTNKYETIVGGSVTNTYDLSGDKFYFGGNTNMWIEVSSTNFVFKRAGSTNSVLIPIP